MKINFKRKIFGIEAYKILIVLFVAIFILSNGRPLDKIFKSISPLQANIGSCSFIQPQFGRIACEPLTSVKATNVYGRSKWQEVTGTLFAAWQMFDTCGDDENTPQCDYTFSGTNGPFFKVEWSKCTKMWDASSCNSPIKVSDYYSADYTSGTEIPLVTLKTGEIIRIWVGADLFGRGDDQPMLFSKYIPFGLNVYDNGGKFRYNVKSCDLKSAGLIDAGNICSQSDGSACLKIKDSDRLAFDDWVNYLSSFVYAPVDLNNKIVTFNGQQAYCQAPGYVYSISEFKTTSTCYDYPNKLIGTVTCCPGMETSNAKCGEDFKWHFNTVGQCNTDNQCQIGYKCSNSQCVLQAECISDLQCPGQGNFITDTTSITPTVQKWACQQNKCQITEKKQVACTPPSTGCSSGTVCDPNSFTCVQQIGPIPIVPIPNQTDWLFWILVIIAIVLVLIIIGVLVL